MDGLLTAALWAPEAERSLVAKRMGGGPTLIALAGTRRRHVRYCGDVKYRPVHRIVGKGDPHICVHARPQSGKRADADE